MVKEFEFNEEKNIWLKETRGISFDDIVKAIKNGNVLDDISHPSEKFPRQRLLVIKEIGRAHV